MSKILTPIEMNALRKKYCPYTDDELILLHKYSQLTTNQKRLCREYAFEMLDMQKDG